MTRSEQIEAADARPADAEPVAWRVWSRHLQDWVMYTSSAAEAKTMGGVVEPLYASPPAPDRTQGAADKLAAHVVFAARRVGLINDDTESFSGPQLLMIIDALADGPAHVAAQADALAALKELVACKDMLDTPGPVIETFNQFKAKHIDLGDRITAAWTEARRVIAATGEKHETY
jgi:hypothetical protein